MCDTCGCGGSGVTIGGKPHAHPHPEPRALPGSRRRVVVLEKDLLARNNLLAADNRAWFRERGLFVLNLVSSPGSGKTTLLVETVRRLQGEFPVAVVEGDQQTSRDADRIRAAGAAAVQINTGKGCHLDAHMVAHAVEDLGAPEGGLLLVENVGNLVCPAGFDLGEAHKVVILSVTEGEDKPLKYPDIFAASDLMILNKIDLLPHLQFDVERCVEAALQVNPALEVIRLSATTGENLDAWLDWIRRRRAGAGA
jgi:hydrogenase nickel incorporation protein HypB